MMTDESLMPFGKYRGRQMADVPADYLLWLYDAGKCFGQVKDYIFNNLDVLTTERGRQEKKQLQNG